MGPGALNSAGELAKVMVEVEVSPALPLGIGERAEDGVGAAAHVVAGKAMECFREPGLVLVEVPGPRAVLLLVDFGAGGDALGPGERQIERAPFHQSAAHKGNGGLYGAVASDA